MGRRSDHSPDELRDLLVEQGHALLSERGLSKFSAREAARRSGYSVGTIYNVFGSLDAYLFAVNNRTFEQWTKWLETALLNVPNEGTTRIEALVLAYFSFAATYPKAWMAVYDHKIDDNVQIAEEDKGVRGALTAIVDREVSSWLGVPVDVGIMRLVRSLIATVHGHCALWLSGSYALMREAEPAQQALARIVEILEAHRRDTENLSEL